MKNLGGQSLIEIIVSIGIAVMLAIALISAGLVTSKTARSAKNNTQASQLAQQYIEEIRVFRDRKGYGALVDNTCYWLNVTDPNPSNWSLVTGTCNPGQGAETVPVDNVTFYRTLAVGELSVPDPNQKLITVTINWADSGGTQTVTNQTILSKWTSP